MADEHISAHEDPQGEAPWVMQLVVRVDKTDPPTHRDVCEAAASAVARLLADDRAQLGGDWHRAVARWCDGRIRKHTRRARGAAWDRAVADTMIEHRCGSAVVRAFVPTPIDEIPAELRRLQLHGLDVAELDANACVDPTPGGPVVVSLSGAVLLSTGKAAAAAAHAAQVAQMQMAAERRTMWAESGWAVVVEQPDRARWDQLAAIAPVRIVDAGFTDVDPGTTTAIARWA